MRCEFTRLEFLIEEKGRTVTRVNIVGRVWPSPELVQSRTVDVRVRLLPTKRGAVGPQKETVFGIICRFVGDSENCQA